MPDSCMSFSGVRESCLVVYFKDKSCRLKQKSLLMWSSITKTPSSGKFQRWSIIRLIAAGTLKEKECLKSQAKGHNRYLKSNYNKCHCQREYLVWKENYTDRRLKGTNRSFWPERSNWMVTSIPTEQKERAEGGYQRFMERHEKHKKNILLVFTTNLNRQAKLGHWLMHNTSLNRLSIKKCFIFMGYKCRNSNNSNIFSIVITKLILS